MHHILKNTILSTHWFLSLYLFIYIYCSISIIKINKFTSLHILGTLWWEGGGTLPVFINKNTPPMEGNISGGVVRFDGIGYPIYRDLQGFFISYVVVQQIGASHHMPTLNQHCPFYLLMTILHLGNKTA